MGLRRTMEKYMAICRVILVTNSTSKVIPAIRSRCLAVRVAAPKHEEICSVLTAVAKKEGCVLPAQLATRIAEKSGRNLRRAAHPGPGLGDVPQGDCQPDRAGAD